MFAVVNISYPNHPHNDGSSNIRITCTGILQWFMKTTQETFLQLKKGSDISI